MIQTILNAIFSFITYIVSLILTPFDAFILSYLPDLSNALTIISTFLNTCLTSIGWVLSVFGLSSSCMSLIVSYFIFKLTVPSLVYFVKLAVKWYHKLVP